MSREPPESLAAQIACIEREIGMRERVYPRWVQLGRIPADKADYEIACMKALLARLEQLQDERAPGLFSDA
jgi:hypothetical protein